MFLTPPEIQHQTLKAGRGYERETVDKLLEDVTASYEQVWLERDELRARVAELERDLSTFRETERYLSDTLVTAQRAAEDVRLSAERTADELRLNAERDADRLKTEALSDLERAKADARRELEDLRVEIENFRTLDRQLRSNLRAFLEAAVRQIEEAGVVQEASAATLTDALSPDTARPDGYG